MNEEAAPRLEQRWTDARGHIVVVRTLPGRRYELVDEQTGKVRCVLGTYPKVMRELTGYTAGIVEVVNPCREGTEALPAVLEATRDNISRLGVDHFQACAMLRLPRERFERGIGDEGAAVDLLEVAEKDLDDE